MSSASVECIERYQYCYNCLPWFNYPSCQIPRLSLPAHFRASIKNFHWYSTRIISGYLIWFAGEFGRLLDGAVTARATELKSAHAGADQHQLSSIDRVKMRRKLLKDALRTFRGHGATRGGLPCHESRVANLGLPGVLHKEVQADLPTRTFYVVVGTTAAVHPSAQRT